MSESSPPPFDFNEAVAKLERAIVGPDGALLPISRVEFEVLDGGRVRWNLWQGVQRVYSAVGQAGDVGGFLGASKMILEMRAAQQAGEDSDA